MKRLIILLCIIVIGMIVNGCQEAIPITFDGPNLLISLEGDVLLKREGWSDYFPVGFGTVVQHGDLLKVEGEAAVLCGDLSLKLISQQEGSPCLPGQGTLEYKGAYFRNALANVPYIQIPRNTLMLDRYPILRWNDTGASSYTVAILLNDTTLWEQTGITGNEMRYPEKAPALQPNVDYLLVVTDNDTGIDSNEDPARGLGFRIVSESERALIQSHQSKILNLSPLEDSARDFVLAMYYASWNSYENERSLWGEAWLRLEAVVKAQDAPSVYLNIGDILMAMKLPNEAEVAYRAALQRAEAMGNLEAQATAQIGLWIVTADEMWFDQAIKSFDTLGDRERVNELRNEKD